MKKLGIPKPPANIWYDPIAVIFRQSMKGGSEPRVVDPSEDSIKGTREDT